MARLNALSLVIQLTLMSPVWAIVIGVVALGETLDGRVLAGAASTLGGLLIILGPNPGRPRSADATNC